MTPRDVPAREGPWTIRPQDRGYGYQVDGPPIREPVEVIPLATAERLAEAAEELYEEVLSLPSMEARYAMRLNHISISFRHALAAYHQATGGGTDG